MYSGYPRGKIPPLFLSTFPRNCKEPDTQKGENASVTSEEIFFALKIFLKANMPEIFTPLAVCGLRSDHFRLVTAELSVQIKASRAAQLRACKIWCANIDFFLYSTPLNLFVLSCMSVRTWSLLSIRTTWLLSI